MRPQQTARSTPPMYVLYSRTASRQAILGPCEPSCLIRPGAYARAHDGAVDGGEHVHQPAVFPDLEYHVGSLTEERLAPLLQQGVRLQHEGFRQLLCVLMNVAAAEGVVNGG